MAIKRGSKVAAEGSSASMTDLMFLLLIFFMVATTLINQNALQVQLPKSTNNVSDKPTTTLTVTEDLRYFLDGNEIRFSDIELRLRELFTGVEKPVLMLSMDKRVKIEEFTKFMNMAKSNGYSLFLMTEPL